jgi:hypothetical protein
MSSEDQFIQLEKRFLNLNTEHATLEECSALLQDYFKCVDDVIAQIISLQDNLSIMADRRLELLEIINLKKADANRAYSVGDRFTSKNYTGRTFILCVTQANTVSLICLETGLQFEPGYKLFPDMKYTYISKEWFDSNFRTSKYNWTKI